MIPLPLKKQLSSVLQDGFVLKRSFFEKCLEMYPLQEWNDLSAKVKKKINPFKRKDNEFLRKFTSGVRIVEADTSGRLLIPKDLCTFAKIKKEVVLTSTINVIEVWDKDLYEEAVSKNEEDLADLAEEVMGNFDLDELS